MTGDSVLGTNPKGRCWEREHSEGSLSLQGFGVEIVGG